MGVDVAMPPGLGCTPPRSPELELHIVGVADTRQPARPGHSYTTEDGGRASERGLHEQQAGVAGLDLDATAAATGGSGGGGVAAATPPLDTPAAPKLTVRLVNIPNQAKQELEALLFDWAKRQAKHYANAAPGQPGWVWWSGELGMTLGPSPTQQCRSDAANSSSGGGGNGDGAGMSSWEDKLRCHAQPAATARTAGHKRRRGITATLDQSDTDAAAGGSGIDAGGCKRLATAAAAAAAAAQPSGRPPPTVPAAPSPAAAAAAGAQQPNHTEKLLQRARAMAEAANFNTAFERANNTPAYDRLRVMPLKLGVGLAASSVPVDTAPAPLTAVLPAASDADGGASLQAVRAGGSGAPDPARRGEPSARAPGGAAPAATPGVPLAGGQQTSWRRDSGTRGEGAVQTAGEAAAEDAAVAEAAGELPKELLAKVMGPVRPVLLSPSGVPLAPRPEAGGALCGGGAAGSGRPQKRQRSNGVHAANGGGDGGLQALKPQYNFLLSRCWNCGSYGHDIQTCFRPRNQAAVDHNRRAAAETRAAQDEARVARAAMRQQRQGGGGGARERGAAHNRYFTAELLPEEDAAQPPSTALAPDTAGTGTGTGTGADAEAGGPTAPGWSDRPLKTAPPGVRPGVLSKALAAALGLASPLDPPPWLTAMALYGLPPSYCDSVRVAAAVAAAERAAGRGGGAAGIRVYGADGEALPMPGEQADEDEDMEEQEEEGAEEEAPRERKEQVLEVARLSAAATVAGTEAAAAAVAVAEAAMAGDVADPQAAAGEVGQAHGGAVMDVAAGGSDGPVGAGPSGEMSRGERCSLRAALEALVCTGALAALGDALLGTHTASAADAGAASNGNGVSGGDAASTQQVPGLGSSDGATGPARAAGATCDNPRDQDAAEAGAPPQAGQPAELPAVGQGASNEAEPDREDLAAPPSPGPPPPPLEPVDMLLPSEPRLVLFPGLNAPPPGAVRMRVKAAWARALASAQRVQAAVAAAVGPLVPRRPIAGGQDAAEHPMEEGWRGRDAGGREAAEGAGAEGETRAAKRGRWGPPGPAAAASAGVSRDGGGVGSGGGGSRGQQPGSLAASDSGAPHGDAGAQGPAPHQQAHGVLHHSLQHQHSQDWRLSQGKPPPQQQQSNHSHQQEQQQRGHSQGPQYSAGHVPLQVQGPAHVPPPPPQQQPQDVSRQGGMQGGSMGLGNDGLVKQQSQQQQQQQQHLTPQQQASFALQQQQFDAMLQQQRQQQMHLQQQQQHMLQQQMQHQQQQYLFEQMVMQQQQGMAGQPYFGGGVGAPFMQQEQGPGMFVFRGMR